MSLQEELLNALKGIEEGFNARLREVEFEWNDDEINCSGKFFYLAFSNKQPNLNNFVQYIFDQIVPFCIPASKIKEQRELFNKSGHIRHIQEIVEQARHLFKSAKEQKEKEKPSKKNSEGEPGELILFILLEAALKAPQIACKMYLKTSEDMAVHGSDSIHIMPDENSTQLVLLWGESKLYQKLSSAFDETVDSINSFLETKENGRASRERDIDIIRDHFNIADEDLKKSLLKYFDPYEEESNELVEGFACFCGFDSPMYQKLKGSNQEEIENHFRKKYEARIKTACDLFTKKIKKKLTDTQVKKFRFYLFLLPFESIDELRKQFYAKIGLQDD